MDRQYVQEHIAACRDCLTAHRTYSSAHRFPYGSTPAGHDRRHVRATACVSVKVVIWSACAGQVRSHVRGLVRATLVVSVNHLVRSTCSYTESAPAGQVVGHVQRYVWATTPIPPFILSKPDKSPDISPNCPAWKTLSTPRRRRHPCTPPPATTSTAIAGHTR